MKPGFYMLAKHGPWEKHVRTKTLDNMDEAVMWLARQGKVENIDFEVLVEDIQIKNSKKVFTPARTVNGRSIPTRQVSVIQPIMFFNDASLASYVKLTWG